MKNIKFPSPRVLLGVASSLGVVLIMTIGSQVSQAQSISAETSEANGDSKSTQKPVAKAAKKTERLDINVISPEFVEQREIVRKLLLRGRTQFINGDYDGAVRAFREAESRDPNNMEAKRLSTNAVRLIGKIQKQNVYNTREQMLMEVDRQWERPKVFDIADERVKDSIENQIQKRLNKIMIPQVNFSGSELSRVIETLSELSVEHDKEKIGVNIVPLFNPNDKNPRVNINLRNLSLDRILQFITQQVNFTYEVGMDAVTVAPSFGPAGSQSTVTEFFPISGGTVIRLTGFGDSAGGALPVDPFADTPPAASTSLSSDEKTNSLKSFFQQAGVNFEIPGSSLAFDGQQLIVTQTRQNIDRMRTILRNYSEIKQVEIEAKFLEVAQSDLEEFGFNWTVSKNGATIAQFNPRSLNSAYASGSAGRDITISSQTSVPETIEEEILSTIVDPLTGATTARILNRTTTPARTTTQSTGIPNAPPIIPLAGDFGINASNVFEGSLGRTSFLNRNYNIDLAIRALSRKSGSDLMSAPKITVLSGKRATITIAQELRYPERYGEIRSNNGGRRRNNNNNNNDTFESNGNISITAATPTDFVTRNVGVELSVLPNVENDDTISLVLEPRVTEFEGFVEYGGPSIAISDGTTVTVPSGFYQPIFSTREIATEVTVFDGATLVMGGMTRDEVRTVKDKLPILGDIPGIGRLFRSEGETRQKRNLLIFVTANLVSPGGSLSRQNHVNAKANELFQNPMIITPSGAVNRSVLSDNE